MWKEKKKKKKNGRTINEIQPNIPYNYLFVASHAVVLIKIWIRKEYNYFNGNIWLGYIKWGYAIVRGRTKPKKKKTEREREIRREEQFNNNLRFY